MGHVLRAAGCYGGRDHPDSSGGGVAPAGAAMTKSWFKGELNEPLPPPPRSPRPKQGLLSLWTDRERATAEEWAKYDAERSTLTARRLQLVYDHYGIARDHPG